MNTCSYNNISDVRLSAARDKASIGACTGFDGGLEVGEAIRSGALR